MSRLPAIRMKGEDKAGGFSSLQGLVPSLGLIRGTLKYPTCVSGVLAVRCF